MEKHTRRFGLNIKKSELMVIYVYIHEIIISKFGVDDYVFYLRSNYMSRYIRHIIENIKYLFEQTK